MNKKMYIAILVIILVCFGVYFWVNTKDNYNEISIDNKNTLDKDTENNVELLELPHDYTISNAIDDGYVAIELNGKLSNKENLDLFFDNAKSGISGNVRIVEEYGEKNTVITDASFDGETLSISYDYSRSSDLGDEIITNNYSMEKYYLLKELEELENGNSVMLYKIINKENSDDIYYLTGYIVYTAEQ